MYNKIALFYKPLLLLFVAGLLSASDSFEYEVKSYSAQKHHADYNRQTPRLQKKLQEEYAQVAKLSNVLLKTGMKDDKDLAVFYKMAVIDMWSKKFLASAQVSDAMLKEFYKQKTPKTLEKYKLSNILVKYNSRAEKIIAEINSVKKPSDRFATFKKLVKKHSQDLMTRKNSGNLGWVEFAKLDKVTQKAIKGKTKDDVIKYNLKGIGWQILYIEEHQPIRDASFEESKEFLSVEIKKEMLRERIGELLKK